MDGGLGGGVERWRDVDEGMDGWMNGRLDRLLSLSTPLQQSQHKGPVQGFGIRQA